MNTNMTRFLEISAQAIVLAGVWRGASAMMASGMSMEPTSFLHQIEPVTIPVTMLAAIGSVVASQIGLRKWRRAKLQKAEHQAAFRSVNGPHPSGALKETAVEELINQVVRLNLENERLNRLLQEKSARLMRDPLTGIHNRLAYEERLQQEFNRWKRFNEPLSFLIWDIDHFKKINDRHGHAAGDEVIRDIARRLDGRIRSTDFVARYGGEEFVMLLPGADRKDALNLAEQIRRDIAKARFGAGGTDISVTISCGVTSFRPGDSAKDVFERADGALYQAKQAGRNCCRDC